MNELALFAGAGGGILGGHLLGWRTVCAVERDLYAASVLASRQNDGHLAPFPIWSDVSTFDGRPWRGIVEVISGGFPCQDISPARNNRGEGLQGISGPKSSAWKHMARVVGEVRPHHVLVENSEHLVRRGLAVVLSDLASLGYDATWGIVGADEIGANHYRKRCWVYASDSNLPQCERGGIPGRVHEEYANARRSTWWEAEPGVHRVDDGIPHRVDRLRATGNAQVPGVAAVAFETLRGILEDS